MGVVNLGSMAGSLLPYKMLSAQLLGVLALLSQNAVMCYENLQMVE